MTVPITRLAIAWALCLLLGSSTTVCAQFQFQQSSNTNDIFLLAPRSLQRLLSEGRKAIDEGRYTDGVASLGAILQDDSDEIPDDLRGQDFFLSRPARGSLYQKSAKGEAIEILKSLPEEGRRTLEIQFGVKARQMLEAAAAAHDIEAVTTVARRYAHTDAAYDAMVLIAEDKLVNGFPLAAADVLQTLLDYPHARRRFGVGLVQSAAICWLQAGKPDRALATVKLAKRDFAGQSLTIDGRQISIEQPAELINALAVDPGDRNIDHSVASWLLPGGSVARNATNEIGMPLPNELWSHLIHSSRPEGQALVESEEQERKNGRLLIPKIDLRIVDNTVISRSNDSSVMGIDFDTGLLRWQRLTNASVAPLKGPAWDSSDNQISSELKNRIWGSTAFGRITCDTQRCYHVVQKQNDTEDLRGLGMGYRQSTSTRLEGLSIAREGGILWSVGGTDSDEPALRTAYFLGPPLPYAGQLYSLVEINGQIELVVLDPASGRLQWRQQLATTTYQIEYDRERQSQGLTPSVSDGVLVCPTGIGGIVAVDLMTRSLRWGATYLASSGGRLPGIVGGAFGGAEYDPLESRWYDESLVIENGCVVVTPPESETLLCYDLLTGEELLKRKRSSSCYVAGIDDGNVILVGNHSVQAIQIGPNESVNWDLQFPAGQLLAGKGIWQARKLMLPLTGGHVIQVDLQQGKILDSAVVNQPLGNLYAHRGVLLTVGPTAITAYYTRQQLESAVATKLARDPQDTWGLNYKSQLLLADGQVNEAFQLLLNSLEVRPDDYETRYFLVDAMLVGLERDFPQFSQYADRIDPIVQPATPQRLKYLQLLAKGLMQQGDNFGAFKRLWQILGERQMALVSGAQPRSNRMQLQPEHSVELDAWFAVELGRTYAKCTPEQQAQIREDVGAMFDKLRNNVVTVRRQLLRQLIQLPAADAENLELAELLRPRETITSEQILSQLARSESSEIRDRAVALLREVPEPAIDSATAQPSPQTDWPTGMVIPSLDETDSVIYPAGRPIEITGDRYGHPPFSISVSDRLVVSDVNGRNIYHLSYRQATGDMNGTFMRAEVRGGLILLESASELIGFDYYQGADSKKAILWRYSLDMASPRDQFQTPRVFNPADAPLGIQSFSRAKSDGRPQVEVGPLLLSAKIIQSGDTVVGLDPYTGRRLWTRDGYASDLQFAGDGRSDTLCIVSPAQGKTELIDARDGQKIGESRYLIDDLSQRYRDRVKRKWEHWYSYGNWLVNYVVEDSSQVSFRIWNPVEEKTLIDTRLSSDARIAQCDRSLIAIVEPTGQMQWIDLNTAETTKIDVPVDGDLASIGMVRFGERIVVAANMRAAQNRQLLNQSELPANGYVYCIGAADKRLQWSQPGRLYNMAIPTSQPRNSPYMAVTRFQATNTGSSLALIDLRSGKLAYVVDAPRVDRGAYFRMELQPAEQQIGISIGEKFFRFLATDIDPPPEPIVDFGNVYQKEIQIKRDNSSLFDQ